MVEERTRTGIATGRADGGPIKSSNIMFNKPQDANNAFPFFSENFNIFQ